MDKLHENASEKEWQDFTLAMVRRAFDDRKWDYWVYCDNSVISISYWNQGLAVKIEPGKVTIACKWRSSTDITDKIEKAICDSKYVRYEKKVEELDYVDSDTGDFIPYTEYNFVFIGEVQVKNRVDPEYIEEFGNCLWDMMEEITNYFGIINEECLAESEL